MKTCVGEKYRKEPLSCEYIYVASACSLCSTYNGVKPLVD